MSVEVKRVYDKPSLSDGTRVLVDRLWPRGLTKEAAHVDRWLKDLAPSNELRKWLHANDSRWLDFRKRYLAELHEPAALAALDELYRLTRRKKRVTLLFASRNERQNNATVLKELVEGMRKPPRGSGPAAAASAGRVRRARIAKR
jgi:uncharacterized protein YeaO (DUF488 family)